MPADADLLCEFYLSSNLNNKKPTLLKKAKSFNSESSSSESPAFLVQQEEAYSFKTTQLPPLADTIEFVKYNKNPMEVIKLKYELLNKNPTTSSAATTNGSSSDTNNSTKTKSLAVSPQPVTATSIQLSTAKPLSQNLNQLFKNSAWLELNWSKIRKIGIGLLNLGNNCYLNATIQCLAYTPPLSQWLINKPHSPMCKFKPVKGFCSLCEVEKIIFDIFNSSNGFAKPNNLCFNIKSERSLIY
jgi:hypothetical protein